MQLCSMKWRPKLFKTKKAYKIFLIEDKQANFTNTSPTFTKVLTKRFCII